MNYDSVFTYHGTLHAGQTSMRFSKNGDLKNKNMLPKQTPAKKEY